MDARDGDAGDDDGAVACRANANEDARARCAGVVANAESSSSSSWHEARIARIERLRQCLQGGDGESFAPRAWGVDIVHRFADAESNRYADAFAATVGAAALPVALKVVPLAAGDERHACAPMSRAALRHSAWVERAALRLCAELVDARCTPSLPYLIRSYVCGAPFSPLAARQRADQPALVLCNEWAHGGNLAQWATRRRRRPAREWHACLFHVFVALYALQKYCALTHHDVHLENILLHNVCSAASSAPAHGGADDDDDDDDDARRGTKRKFATSDAIDRDEVGDEQHASPVAAAKAQDIIGWRHGADAAAAGSPPRAYWQYNVDGRTYYVPECLGFVPVLWDFGVAFRPDTCTNESFAHVHPCNERERRCADAVQLLSVIGDMRDTGQISIPATSWYPYATMLSWRQWSMRYAIPFAFERHFGRRPPPNATVLVPSYDVSRDAIVPADPALQPFFAAAAPSSLE